MKKEIMMYTDGACSGNPGVGGWGVVMFYKEHCKEQMDFGQKEKPYKWLD